MAGMYLVVKYIFVLLLLLRLLHQAIVMKSWQRWSLFFAIDLVACFTAYATFDEFNQGSGMLMAGFAETIYSVVALVVYGVIFALGIVIFARR